MAGQKRVGRAETAREKILETAEQLYALHGIDAVSIRQINQEAGQKNGSAVHYHFGSREGLIEAIFEHRVGPGNERRLLLLDRLKEASADHLPGLRGIAEAMVRPLFDGIAAGATSYSRRFFKQVHMQHNLMDKLLSHKHDLGLRECFRLIRWSHPDVPTPILYHRYIHANAIMVDSAANLEERNDLDAASLNQQRIDLHIECCIDSVSGVFEAPISEAAMSLVGDHKKASDALERMRSRASI
ncbi:helix-turn-helix domain-containing protein [Oceanicola sp. 22II-s10i]|uniref:helix-turn-helix domain-containing protein n=1 Tax=Oceanicola sp. 22II-s10i TaxID=1317116 RepID=UPI001594FEB8|nr:helix-turn-helix domain-containing protein [Oceanicola sp. 22II-s10i]